MRCLEVQIYRIDIDWKCRMRKKDMSKNNSLGRCLDRDAISQTEQCLQVGIWRVNEFNFWNDPVVVIMGISKWILSLLVYIHIMEYNITGIINYSYLHQHIMNLKMLRERQIHSLWINLLFKHAKFKVHGLNIHTYIHT